MLRRDVLALAEDAPRDTRPIRCGALVRELGITLDP